MRWRLPLCQALLALPALLAPQPTITQFVQRALEHQPPGPHHTNVRADLVDLGQQVRRDEDRDPVRGDLPDQATDLARPLPIKAIGRLVEEDQLARP